MSTESRRGYITPKHLAPWCRGTEGQKAALQCGKESTTSKTGFQSAIARQPAMAQSSYNKTANCGRSVKNASPLFVALDFILINCELRKLQWGFKEAHFAPLGVISRGITKGCYFYIVPIIASANSLVLAEPPISRVRTLPSSKTVSIARSIFSAAPRSSM